MIMKNSLIQITKNNNNANIHQSISHHYGDNNNNNNFIEDYGEYVSNIDNNKMYKKIYKLM